MQVLAHSVGIPRISILSRVGRPSHVSARPFNGNGITTPVLKNGRFVTVRVQQAPKDFDEVLIDIANKFEKADNKAAIVGWTSAAFGGLVLAEWFIHLPLFNVFIGFPIQFVGLLVAAKYGLRIYKNEKVDFMGEFQNLVKDFENELPGLKK